MLRILALAAGVLMAGSAAAQEIAHESPADWHEANYACRMGEARDGAKLTPQETEAGCSARENLGSILEAHGYCWSRSEQEWFVRGEDEGFCASPAN